MDTAKFSLEKEQNSETNDLIESAITDSIAYQSGKKGKDKSNKKELEESVNLSTQKVEDQKK